MRSPGVAQESISRYDSLCAKGVKQHRVTEHFLHPGSRLRAHLENIARGEPICSELAAELMPLEWGSMSESMVEGEHRSLAVESGRSHAARHPFAVATVRMKQDRAMIKQIWADKMLRLKFEKCFRCLKQLGLSPKSDSRVRLHCPNSVRKTTFKQVCSSAYRLGSCSFQDF